MMPPTGDARHSMRAAMATSAGEGCGRGGLERLSDALPMGPHLAVIRRPARQSGWPIQRIGCPELLAQHASSGKALANAGVDPSQSATSKLTAPARSWRSIEVEALAEIYGQTLGGGLLPAGSVKTNIAISKAPPIAGLIKSCCVPAARNPSSPALSDAESEHLSREHPLRHPHEHTRWPQVRGRISGVSSFGFAALMRMSF